LCSSNPIFRNTVIRLDMAHRCWFTPTPKSGWPLVISLAHLLPLPPPLTRSTLYPTSSHFCFSVLQPCGQHGCVPPQNRAFMMILWRTLLHQIFTRLTSLAHADNLLRRPFFKEALSETPWSSVSLPSHFTHFDLKFVSVLSTPDMSQAELFSCCRPVLPA
jgi:hypothetical protein